MSETPEITPEEEMRSVEQELNEKAASSDKLKADDYYDQLLRLRAEFDNFRRRVDREKRDARAWGKQDVLMQTISLVDIFEQALTQAHKAKELKQVVEGVDMLYKSFAQFLKMEGLEPLNLVGKPFDPHNAEVLEQEEVDDEDQVGIVLAELQKGYVFQGRVLRPSRVRVGVAKKENSKDENEEEQDA
jgi:molecular chaperone GrpE